MIHITIDSYLTIRPASPPRAECHADAAGRLHVDVEDIGDPEVEAVAAARAVLEYFLSLHDNVKAS